MTTHSTETEERLIAKAERRSRKRKQRMAVHGKSVFRLRELKRRAKRRR